MSLINKVTNFFKTGTNQEARKETNDDTRETRLSILSLLSLYIYSLTSQVSSATAATRDDFAKLWDKKLPYISVGILPIIPKNIYPLIEPSMSGGGDGGDDDGDVGDVGDGETYFESPTFDSEYEYSYLPPDSDSLKFGIKYVVENNPSTSGSYKPINSFGSDPVINDFDIEKDRNQILNNDNIKNILQKYYKITPSELKKALDETIKSKKTVFVDLTFNDGEKRPSSCVISEDGKYILIKGINVNGLKVSGHSCGTKGLISGAHQYKNVEAHNNNNATMVLKWENNEWNLIMFAPEGCMNFALPEYLEVEVQAPEVEIKEKIVEKIVKVPDTITIDPNCPPAKPVKPRKCPTCPPKKKLCFNFQSVDLSVGYGGGVNNYEEVWSDHGLIIHTAQASSTEPTYNITLGAWEGDYVDGYYATLIGFDEDGNSVSMSFNENLSGANAHSLVGPTIVEVHSSDGTVVSSTSVDGMYQLSNETTLDFNVREADIEKPAYYIVGDLGTSFILGTSADSTEISKGVLFPIGVSVGFEPSSGNYFITPTVGIGAQFTKSSLVFKAYLDALTNDQPGFQPNSGWAVEYSWKTGENFGIGLHGGQSFDKNGEDDNEMWNVGIVIHLY